MVFFSHWETASGRNNDGGEVAIGKGGAKALGFRFIFTTGRMSELIFPSDSRWRHAGFNHPQGQAPSGFALPT